MSGGHDKTVNSEKFLAALSHSLSITMYSSPYDVVTDRMAGLYVGRRPETLIGAPKDTHQQDQQFYANDPMLTTTTTPSRHDRVRMQYSPVRRADMSYTQLPGSTEAMMLMPGMYQKRRLQSGMFNRLSDGIALKIFSYLDTADLLTVTQVCKRFEGLCWNSPECWRCITLKGDERGDKILKMIFKRLLSGGSPPGHLLMDASLPFIERVHISNGCRVTDKSLGMLSRRCPELTHLQVQCCNEIYDSGVAEILNNCMNLQHLDLTGCLQVANICAGHELTQRRFLLQYLDLTDCISIDDCSLQNIVRHCPSLVYMYLRRCVQITDAGLKCIASYCSMLRELSISDCIKVSDFGLYELAGKVGSQLRYLSVAKCSQVTDAGLKVIARRCYKLRYLNARGCAVSDDSIMCLARCCPRLRAIDLGTCDVSDTGLKVLAESCPNLKKLSLRNCDMISDNGLNYISYYCRGLSHLNIQDCPISIEGYRSVKMYCKRCVIEHTNPGFG